MKAQDDFVESLVRNEPRLLALWEIGPVQRAAILDFADKLAAQAVNDATRAIELKGYRKGYVAGRRKQKSNRDHLDAARRRGAFWQRAFIAAIPATFGASGWSMSGKKVVTLPERIELAVHVADEAVKAAARRVAF